MKRAFFYIIMLLLLFGCASGPSHIPGHTEIAYLDLSTYSQWGFLITPGDYGGDYETIGMISISEYAAATKKRVKSERGNYLERWTFSSVDPDLLIEKAYDKAISLGANAITRFVIKPESKPFEMTSIGLISIPGYSVSGMLIKRK